MGNSTAPIFLSLNFSVTWSGFVFIRVNSCPSVVKVFWLRLGCTGYFVVQTAPAALIRASLVRRGISALDFRIQPMQAGFDPGLHLAHVFGEGQPVRVITGGVAPAGRVPSGGLSQCVNVCFDHAPDGCGGEFPFAEFLPAP